MTLGSLRCSYAVRGSGTVGQSRLFQYVTSLLKAALICAAFSVFICTAGVAQSNPDTPRSVASERVDALIDAISDAVVAKLQKAGQVAQPSEKLAQLAGPTQAMPSRESITILDRFEAMVAGYPELWRNLALIPVVLDRSGQNGRGLASYLTALAAIVALAFASGLLVRRFLATARRRLTARLSGVPSFRHDLALACLDALGPAMFALVGIVLAHALFRGHYEQARFAVVMLSMLSLWRFLVLLLEVFFRPDLSAARLVPVDDADADAVQSRLVIVIGVVLAFRLVFHTLRDMHTSSEALAAWQFSVGFVAVGLLVWAMRDLRHPIERWLCALPNGKGKSGQFWIALGRHWIVLAVPALMGLWVAQIYGALVEDPLVPGALLLTVALLFALLLFETLVHHILNRRSGTAGTRLRGVIERIARVAVCLAVAFTIANVWIVDVLELADTTQWPALTHAAITSACVLFAAYAGWEAIDVLASSYGSPKATPGIGSVGDEASPAPSASRLATILPVLRAVALIGLITISALVILDEVGVNITPLVAVVSVVGLALSFGSQTLVRDIVSGVFYLADDAFRVGEYIDCGRAKGTVEGFTLRSIRLRHQNGQIFTIPFGQLGQITNFSRDWCTIKFNLRFARDIDIEKLRKTVKKVGLEMMQDAEFKDEFLEPLKLQGVADVADNALIMRFKFTCKPNIPTRIQRDAMKRLFPALQAAGIEFASATVSVQTIGDSIDPRAAAAATTSIAAK